MSAQVQQGEGETTNKEDPTQLSKRKKQTENMRGQENLGKRPKFDWTQSQEDVTIRLRVDKMKESQMKNMDVQFADNDVAVRLPDGRCWTWNLCGEIFREKSRVSVKKHSKSINITFHMKKKEQILWATLEAIREASSESNTTLTDSKGPSVNNGPPDSKTIETDSKGPSNHIGEPDRNTNETDPTGPSMNIGLLDNNTKVTVSPEPSKHIGLPGSSMYLGPPEVNIIPPTPSTSLESNTDNAVPESKLPDKEITGNGTGVKSGNENNTDALPGNNHEGGDGTGIKMASTTQAGIDSEANIKTPETENEKFIKEEEPVVELQHIKHDFMDKEDVMTVHIYVKEVNKDHLLVNFENDSIGVKFQTDNRSFLNLHADSTNDTKFSWQIKLRAGAVKEKCKYKVTSNLIELTVVKEKPGRWGDLEALKRKPDASSSKTDNWTPVDGVTVRSEGQTEKQAMFDEMRQNIEKENLNQRAPDAESSTSSSSVNDFMKKPTCNVQPLNKQSEEMELAVTPGFTGLNNLGNTCFMNGVLQCLVNTREFRDFFLSGDFQNDLNTENVLGSGGKLAVSFAVLCRVLWSGKYPSYPPSKLKNLVAQKASQFTGFAQHDSQEFLAFLLDGLHEDVNRVKKKPYTETVEDEGRGDEVVADQAWSVHKKRNDSFIVDLFQGQYKSKLVCPVCGKVSITFDPFLYLTLPIPKGQRLLPVTFVWKDMYRKPIRYMLRLSKAATVDAMKKALQKKTGVKPCDIRVFEACKGKIYKIFGRGASLSLVQANDNIIACEVLSEELAGEPVHEIAVIQRTLMPNSFPTRCSSCKRPCPEGSKLKRCTKCFKVGYCDQNCQKTHWQAHKVQCKMAPEPVGTPFIISIPESRATYAKLCHLMEAYARYSVDFFQPPVKVDPPSKLSSHLSSSSLSNSSQSSGSLNSLDSQSSFCSSCTITAEQEQEQNLEGIETDVDAPNLHKADDNQHVDCDTNQADLPAAGSDIGMKIGAQSGIQGTQSGCSDEPFVKMDGTIDSGGEGDACRTERPESGYCSVSSTTDAEQGAAAGTTGLGGGNVAAPGGELGEKEYTLPVRPVLGIPSADSERVAPTSMFFLKPVSADGVGLTGDDGLRIEDKGDQPLDLTNKFFLSMDWKNNDKLPGYVLIQSKDMETENDSSMMSTSLEETNITLEQCLEMFTEPEILNPEEAWYCPQCKEHREATKQLSTWRLPHTLIIQLKRFSFRNFIWRDKIDKIVEFPTRGLDLSSYYVGTRPSNEPPPIYDLYGVVNHHGGILGGHYTSYVRCADDTDGLRSEVGWRLCDDSRVCSVSHEKNVVTRSAYLLFYRRRQLFTGSPTAALTSEASDDDEAFESAVSDVDEMYENSKDSPDSEAKLVIDTSSLDQGTSVDQGISDLEDGTSNLGTKRMASPIIRENVNVNSHISDNGNLNFHSSERECVRGELDQQCDIEMVSREQGNNDVITSGEVRDNYSNLNGEVSSQRFDNVHKLAGIQRSVDPDEANVTLGGTGCNGIGNKKLASNAKHANLDCDGRRLVSDEAACLSDDSAELGYTDMDAVD